MVVKRYDIAPELLGEYAFDASAASQTRENVDRTNAARQDQAQLAQQGAIAGGQMQQHALDRQATIEARGQQAALEADSNRIRLQANTDDNRTAETLQKLKGEQAGADLQNQMKLKEFGSNLDRRNKLADDMAVPNFLDGPMQEHGQAVGNQRLIDVENNSHNEELVAKASTGDPRAMEQALSQGLFRFSPQQQGRLQELQGALGKLNDPRLSPQDRLNGEVAIREEMKSIQPQLVPKSERTPSLNDQLNKAIGVWTDPTGNKTYPMALNRNGVPEVVDLSANKEPDPLSVAYGKDPDVTIKANNEAYKRAYDIAAKRHDAFVDANKASGGSAKIPEFTGPSDADVQVQLDRMLGKPPAGSAQDLMGRISAAVGTNNQINAGATAQQEPPATDSGAMGAAGGAMTAAGGVPGQSVAAPSAPAPTIQAPPAAAPPVKIGSKELPPLGMFTMPGSGEQVPITAVKIGGQNLSASVKDGVGTLLAWDENNKPVPVGQFQGDDAGLRRNPIKFHKQNLGMIGNVVPHGTFLIDENGTVYENKPPKKK